MDARIDLIQQGLNRSRQAYTNYGAARVVERTLDKVSLLGQPGLEPAVALIRTAASDVGSTHLRAHVLQTGLEALGGTVVAGAGFQAGLAIKLLSTLPSTRRSIQMPAVLRSLAQQGQPQSDAFRFVATLAERFGYGELAGKVMAQASQGAELSSPQWFARTALTALEEREPLTYSPAMLNLVMQTLRSRCPDSRFLDLVPDQGREERYHLACRALSMLAHGVEYGPAARAAVVGPNGVPEMLAAPSQAGTRDRAFSNLFAAWQAESPSSLYFHLDRLAGGLQGRYKMAVVLSDRAVGNDPAATIAAHFLLEREVPQTPQRLRELAGAWLGTARGEKDPVRRLAILESVHRGLVERFECLPPGLKAAPEKSLLGYEALFQNLVQGTLPVEVEKLAAPPAARGIIEDSSGITVGTTRIKRRQT